jgi:predicted ATPase
LLLPSIPFSPTSDEMSRILHFDKLLEYFSRRFNHSNKIFPIMELLYVWIKKYKNIEEQGFNFSPKWRFHYDPKTGNLDVEDRRDKVIDNFFGENISNVTAIVGENGSGKSQALHELGYSAILERLQNITVVKIDKKLKIYTKEKISVFGLDSSFFDLVDENYNSLHEIFGLYYSANVDFNMGGQFRGNSQHFINFSTNNLLSSFQDSIESYYPHQSFVNKTFTSYPNFLNPFLYFDTVNQLLFYFKHKELIDEYGFVSNQVSIFGGYDTFPFNLNFITDLRNSVKEYFLASLILKLVKNLKNHLGITEFFFHNSLEYISFEELENDFVREVSSYNNEKAHNHLKLYEKIVHLIEQGFVVVPEKPLSFAIFDILSHFEEFKTFVYFYQNCVFSTSGNFLNFPDYFLNIHWGKIQNYQFSTGERYLFNILSRLYYLASSIKEQNILLFLDETESGFHPEWQRRYFTIFMKFLPKIFENKSLQIILTSHSPFVLSDLPKENVIFLKKGEDGKCQVVDGLHEMKQTFGANIHTLLSDGFFMDGLMGDFAKGKIDEVIQYLNGETVNGMDDDKAEKIIQMIGEPILKRHLQQQFQYRKQNTELKKLREEVKQLKKQIKPQA